jgi:hypothetical protein
MRKTYTPLELVLVAALVLMTSAAVFATYRCKLVCKEADCWHQLYTNTIYRGSGK